MDCPRCGHYEQDIQNIITLEQPGHSPVIMKVCRPCVYGFLAWYRRKGD